MHRESLILCCYACLFIVISLEPRRNSANDDVTIQYAPHTIFTGGVQKKWQYNLHENITEDNNETQHEFRTNFTKEDRESDGTSTEYEFHTTRNHKEDDRRAVQFDVNSTSVEDESYSTLHELPNLSKDNNNTECVNNNSCIQLCCPLGEHLIKEKCVTGEGNYSFPVVRGYTNNSSQMQKANKSMDQVLQLIVHDPCQGSNHLLLNETDGLEYDIFANGSLHLSRWNMIIQPKSYCLAIVHQDKYDALVCKQKRSAFPIIVTVGVIVSLPFLLATFVVYSILPELQNMHGYTLRAHVSSLFVTYLVLAVYQQTTLQQLGYTMCFILVKTVLLLRRKTRSSQGNVKQRDRKKFMLYALYGWGCAFILIIICILIDYVLVVPENFIRPEFCVRTLWFSERVARTYYFYIPVGITIVCNICLFISTALTIARHKKDTDQHLRNSTETRRQDENKQWFVLITILNYTILKKNFTKFKMYLKLFILMGIIWIMEIIAVHSWAFNNPPAYIWYPTDMINALQGVIIFLIFVWKRKIGLLLMKRLGYQNCLCFYRNSTNNDCHSTSTSYTTASGTVTLQSVSPCAQTYCGVKSSPNETNT
ncbi:putative G-protein coupled receptor Mth-like protein [Ooceraea biroi]|uniref:Putative G-protein coupled receptor Mth-like protein n=1 Tax=Ooceraea biroi TaxID=2015173 RepID=A0A026WCW6_OOCBI|nr:putative G-protein coupled receptor Mth-like protein [Ooceraea biroi]